MSSFITANEKDKKKWKLLWVEELWLKFNPSPPSITSILDEDINFIPTSILICGLQEAAVCSKHDHPVDATSGRVAFCQHL
jgi:hypothetical protein